MYSEIDGSDYGLDIIINDRTDDDGYCHCGARMDGVQGSDSARYKMWGNGIALPCAVDVLRRIAKAMEDTDGSQTD